MAYESRHLFLIHLRIYFKLWFQISWLLTAYWCLFHLICFHSEAWDEGGATSQGCSSHSSGGKTRCSPTVKPHSKFCLPHDYYNPLVIASHKAIPRVKGYIQPTMRPKKLTAKSNTYWDRKYIPPKGGASIFWTIIQTITDIFKLKYSWCTLWVNFMSFTCTA